LVRRSAANYKLKSDKAFLLELISVGNQESYDYLIRYLAHALQFPEEKPEVMIILKGGQGK
jgi:hypothetical protein